LENQLHFAQEQYLAKELYNIVAVYDIYAAYGDTSYNTTVTLKIAMNFQKLNKKSRILVR
jgi:hypothetical protein